MDMEREKNRIRKLESHAKGGREWDEGKEEQKPEGREGYRRRANGVVAGVVAGDFRGGRRGGAQMDGANDWDNNRGGRGGYGSRGRGEGRGRGRGDRGRGGPSASNTMEQPAPDPVVDFPALPTGTKPAGTVSLPPEKADESLKSPIVGTSWADQVNEKES